jgi:hemolysin activation/secretion protein
VRQVTVRGKTGHRTRDIRNRLVALTVFASGLVVLGFLEARAQAPPPLGDPTLRSGEPRQPQLPAPGPLPPPPQILPLPPPPPPRELELFPRERVLVREIRVVGSTVVSSEEIASVTAPYVGREVTAEDLEALRQALTLLYINRGYVNSGAILPDQTVTGGVITFEIVEGTVTAIDVEGTRWFWPGYLRRRLALGTGPPLNVDTLQRQLQLLLEDPRIRRLNADLKPGLQRGESVLDVRVEERPPFRALLAFDNYQSPSIGAERGTVILEDLNLTGNGDVLTLRYGKSEGVDPLLDFRYAVPVTARDTTVFAQYRKNTFNVIDPTFKALQIVSESSIYTLGLRQPIYRTLTDEVAIELIGERSSDDTSLLGEPFTLSPGARKGESVTTALRTVQEWIHRSQSDVIAARSRFSVGLEALGATINGGGVPDGRFFAWLGQFQWVRRLPIRDVELVFRTDLQLAADRLLILEQIAVGGRYSVRGYRENTLVRDNAFLTSLEARVPLVRNVSWADFLELAPFVDYGRAWSTRVPTPDPPDLTSVGIGLRWAASIPGPVPIRPQLEVYWGHALRNVQTAGGNLQDKGVHLQFVLSFF